MNRNMKIRRKKDTFMPFVAHGTTLPMFGNTLLSSTALPLPTPSQGSNFEENVQTWFVGHKLVVFGVLPLLVIVLVFLLVHCVRGLSKNKRTESSRKLTSLGYEESMTYQDYDPPQFTKTTVQPARRQETQEIKELGRLEFSVKYDCYRSQLNVNVIRGEDFPLLSSSNVSFTYVVIELRPFSQKYEAKAQTRYVRNNVSPIFNDKISYQIPEDEVIGQSLYLSVYDINHLSAHDLIGSVKVQLDKRLAGGYMVRYKEKLRWKDESAVVFGELLVGLRWKRIDEILEIAIQEASNLKIMDEERQTSNPYVKIQVYVNSFLVLKKRTKVEKRNLFPKFRKTFRVHIPPTSLPHHTQIVLTAKHVAKFRKKQVIGQLYLGDDGKASVNEQWCAMKKGNEFVEIWHQLDASIDKSLLQPKSKVNYLMFDDYNSDEDSCCYSSDRSGVGQSSFDYKSF